MPTTKTCPICSKQFETTNFRPRHTCSSECRVVLMRETDGKRRLNTEPVPVLQKSLRVTVSKLKDTSRAKCPCCSRGVKVRHSISGTTWLGRHYDGNGVECVGSLHITSYSR